MKRAFFFAAIFVAAVVFPFASARAPAFAIAGGTSILTLDRNLIDSAIAVQRKAMTKTARTMEARLWPTMETPNTRPCGSTVSMA